MPPLDATPSSWRGRRPWLRPLNAPPIAMMAATWVIGSQPAALASTAETAICRGNGGAMGIGLQLILAIALLVVTALVHTLVTVVQAELLHRPWLKSWCRHHAWRRIVLILAMAQLTGGAMIMEIGLWGLLYWQMGLIQGLEASLYFAGITFTTVGYGDMTLHGCWRLLSVGEAVNGVLMAGWSTAQLVYVVQTLMTIRLSSEGRIKEQS
jgi:hypothetical protein